MYMYVYKKEWQLFDLEAEYKRRLWEIIWHAGFRKLPGIKRCWNGSMASDKPMGDFLGHQVAADLPGQSTVLRNMYMFRM